MLMRMISDENLAQVAWLIGCQRTGEAIVFDPERDVDRCVDLAAAHGLRIVAVAETHIHADFVSGARELAARTGALAYVSGEGGPEWTSRWVAADPGDHPVTHRLLHDGDTFSVGNIDFRVVHTPGHTPEHLCYVVTDRGGGATEPIGIISGDFLFVGDLGRPDLLETAAGQAGMMESSAIRLHESVRRLDDLADHVQVWPGHGAGSACGKALGAVPTSTIGYERRFNPALRAAADERGFLEFILAGQPEPPLYFATMKRVNRDGPPVLGGLPDPPRQDAAGLRGVDPRAVAILDTRPWDAFRRGHVPGSLSIPMGRTFSTDAGCFVRDGEPIHLIVRPGDLEEAVRGLIRVGLDEIRAWHDASALDAWEDADHTLHEVTQVNAADAHTMVDAGDVAVLDVRRATEFAEGHVPGAVNIAHTRLMSRLDDVPTGSRLLVNCRSGVRSARSCAALMRAGHRVINLEGGFLAWEQLEGVAIATP
jgi:hydroxyacylglutathione hydrolase